MSQRIFSARIKFDKDKKKKKKKKIKRQTAFLVGLYITTYLHKKNSYLNKSKPLYIDFTYQRKVLKLCPFVLFSLVFFIIIFFSLVTPVYITAKLLFMPYSNPVVFVSLKVFSVSLL